MHFGSVYSYFTIWYCCGYLSNANTIHSTFIEGT